MSAVVKLNPAPKPGVVRVQQRGQVYTLPTSPRNAPPQNGSLAFKYHGNKKFTSSIVGADYGRRIEGIATTPTIDRHKESLSSMGCKISLPVPLLWAHGDNPSIAHGVRALKELRIGEVYSYTKSENEIRIRARMDDSDAANYAWNILVQDEALRCLSVGPTRIERGGFVNGVKFCKRWEMRELSVCEIGANPDCTFRIVDGQ